MNQESEDEILSNSLSVDIDRKEMSWNDKLEMLLKRWANDCKEISEKHTVLSKMKKRIYYTVQFPTIIIPFVLSFVNTFEDDYISFKFDTEVQKFYQRFDRVNLVFYETKQNIDKYIEDKYPIWKPSETTYYQCKVVEGV